MFDNSLLFLQWLVSSFIFQFSKDADFVSCYHTFVQANHRHKKVGWYKCMLLSIYDYMFVWHNVQVHVIQNSFFIKISSGPYIGF